VELSIYQKIQEKKESQFPQKYMAAQLFLVRNNKKCFLRNLQIGMISKRNDAENSALPSQE